MPIKWYCEAEKQTDEILKRPLPPINEDHPFLIKF